MAQPVIASTGSAHPRMPRLAANLHYLFTEVPFLERFDCAAEVGFKGVEFQVPYDYPGAELRARLSANGLEMVLFDARLSSARVCREWWSMPKRCIVTSCT
jgi:hydroxypyruvate isomerase